MRLVSAHQLRPANVPCGSTWTARLRGTSVTFSQEADRRDLDVADAMSCRHSILLVHRLWPATCRPSVRALARLIMKGKQSLPASRVSCRLGQGQARRRLRRHAAASATASAPAGNRMGAAASVTARHTAEATSCACVTGVAVSRTAANTRC